MLKANCVLNKNVYNETMNLFFWRKSKKYQPSLLFIAFWQALGLTFYCSLVGSLMLQSNKWFGKVHTFIGPTMFLTLFVVSALVCTLIVLGYPFYLFWEKKQTVKALEIVFYTTLWLIFFILLFMGTLILI